MELDLNYFPAKGVSFECSTCPKSIQKNNRCREDRMDFTEKDGSIWPMYVTKGSLLFSFCPGKATWDRELVSIYRSLKIAAESGTMWIAGGIGDQPEWWIELLSWFLPRYNDLRFSNRIKSIVGENPAALLQGLIGGSRGHKQR